MDLKSYTTKKECIYFIKCKEHTDYDIQSVGKIMFKHSNTYSLTEYGNYVLKKYYEHKEYKFKMTKSKQRYLLSREVDSPYHYDNVGFITIYDMELAFHIDVMGGVGEWLP